MKTILIILFAVTLIYSAQAGRLRTLIRMLIIQGILLFGLAFLELDLAKVNLVNLIFILAETILFKAILVPFILNWVMQRNNIHHESEPDKANFFSLLFVTAVLAASFILSDLLHDNHLKGTYFMASIASMVIGLYLIVSRKKVVTHIVGYMILENGIFLLSLAVGNEMPMVVNSAILLDLLASVLILGVFINRIGDFFKTSDTGALSDLKD